MFSSSESSLNFTAGSENFLQVIENLTWKSESISLVDTNKIQMCPQSLCAFEMYNKIIVWQFPTRFSIFTFFESSEVICVAFTGNKLKSEKQQKAMEEAQGHLTWF